MKKLKKCPVCKQRPTLGCACGEYFVFGEDHECPCCGDAFSEMHTDPRTMIRAWNRQIRTMQPVDNFAAAVFIVWAVVVTVNLLLLSIMAVS